MKIANYTGQHQEVHYQEWTEIKNGESILNPAETVIVGQNEIFDLDLRRIGRPEMTRIVNVFTEIKEEKKIVKPIEQKRPMVKDGE